MLAAFPSAGGEDRKLSEYDVKAAYLYNFGKFVRWPAEAESGVSFNICILGRDPFGATLDSLVRDEKIEGRAITVTRIGTADQAASCRILYVSDSESRRLATVLGTLGNAPVLTVSDIPEFADRGGMIEFVRDGDRIRFLVNVKPAAPKKMNFSSELLRVAARVVGGGER